MSDKQLNGEGVVFISMGVKPGQYWFNPHVCRVARISPFLLLTNLLWRNMSYRTDASLVISGDRGGCHIDNKPLHKRQ